MGASFGDDPACIRLRRRGIIRFVTGYPLHAHVLLGSPSRVAERLERVREAGLVDEVPNLFQIELGVARMWLRLLFRPETVGTSEASPRRSLRARLLEPRAMRFPFLLREQAIAPFDHSGLVSPPERVMKHLLAAHHDRNQFSYDLEMLALEPGRLEELLARARAVAESDDARARWLKDLAVYEGYHESLVHNAERATRGDFGLPEPDASDPDVSFRAYMRWCARQPRDARELRDAIVRGTLDLGAYRPAHVPIGSVPSRDAFRSMSRTELFGWLERGHPLDVDALVGQVYRGTSLGIPHAIEGLSWTTFQKAFVRDEARALVRGFNVRLVQNGLHAPSVPMMNGTKPLTFGHFLVRSGQGEIPVSAPNALLLDYGGLPRANPIAMRALRDPIVALSPGSADVLLGWSYLEVGGARVGTPSFFLLEREGPVGYVPEPS